MKCVFGVHPILNAPECGPGFTLPCEYSGKLWLHSLSHTHSKPHSKAACT